MHPAAVLLLLAPQAPDAAQFDRLWDAGRRVQAIEVLAQRVEAGAGRAERRRLAEAQMSVHWYQAAFATLAPLGAEVDGLRGVLLYKLGRYEEALAKLEPDAAAHCLMRVESLEALGREAEVDAAVERAAALLGEDDVRVLGYRGRALARSGRHAAAVLVFARALEADPWNAAALYGRGRARLAAGEREAGLLDLERHRELAPLLDALDFALRGLDLAPAHGPNHAAVGDAERALGRHDRARAAYERGLELSRDAELVPVALRLARLFAEDLADVDAAVAALERSAARVRDARLWVRAGDLLHADGRSLDAIQRYTKARELRPDDAAIAARIEAAHEAYRRDPGR